MRLCLTSTASNSNGVGTEFQKYEKLNSSENDDEVCPKKGLTIMLVMLFFFFSFLFFFGTQLLSFLRHPVRQASRLIHKKRYTHEIERRSLSAFFRDVNFWLILRCHFQILLNTSMSVLFYKHSTGWLCNSWHPSFLCEITNFQVCARFCLRSDW